MSGQGQDEGNLPAASTVVYVTVNTTRVIREIVDSTGNVIQTQEEDLPEGSAAGLPGVVWTNDTIPAAPSE